MYMALRPHSQLNGWSWEALKKAGICPSAVWAKRTVADVFHGLKQRIFEPDINGARAAQGLNTTWVRYPPSPPNLDLDQFHLRRGI